MAKNITIFRFNFTDEIMTKLTAFAKLHVLDDRHAFKYAWAVWLEINDEDIRVESERLLGLGYRGNIIAKMFKAAKYYFKNKNRDLDKDQDLDKDKDLDLVQDLYLDKDKDLVQDLDKDLDEEKREKEKRFYLALDSEFLASMDSHISRNITNKPSTGYDSYCELNAVLIKNEIERILAEDHASINQKICVQKIKKAYKNRYFIYSKHTF